MNVNIHAGNILPAPDFTQSVVLASSVGAAFDVPTGMGYVVFSVNQDFWVRYGSTAAAIPTAASTAPTNSELNPTARNVKSTAATTGISIISAVAAIGSLNWYKP
jgi:hypothetical protein